MRPGIARLAVVLAVVTHGDGHVCVAVAKQIVDHRGPSVHLAILHWQVRTGSS